MAEGYLFELERRGYLQAGAFIPEVVLELPHVVKSVYVAVMLFSPSRYLILFEFKIDVQ